MLRKLVRYYRRLWLHKYKNSRIFVSNWKQKLGYLLKVLHLEWKSGRLDLVLSVVLDVADDVHRGGEHTNGNDQAVNNFFGQRNPGAGRSRNPGLVSEATNQGLGWGCDQSTGGGGDHLENCERIETRSR